MMTDPVPKMPDFRSALVGKKVVLAERDASGLGIQLEQGWNIAIWTKFAFRCSAEGGMAEDYGVLQGSRLTMFLGDEKQEKLMFDNGCELYVDLIAAADSKFEAMAVYGPEKLIVIWE